MNATMGRQVELTIEDARWQDAGLKRLAKRAVKATLSQVGLREGKARHDGKNDECHTASA